VHDAGSRRLGPLAHLALELLPTRYACRTQLSGDLIGFDGSLTQPVSSGLERSDLVTQHLGLPFVAGCRFAVPFNLSLSFAQGLCQLSDTQLHLFGGTLELLTLRLFGPQSFRQLCRKTYLRLKLPRGLGILPQDQQLGGIGR
jgi:hypothetical protein